MILPVIETLKNQVIGWDMIYMWKVHLVGQSWLL